MIFYLFLSIMKGVIFQFLSQPVYPLNIGSLLFFCLFVCLFCFCFVLFCFDLMLYTVTLLKLFIRFRSSQVECLKLVKYIIISTANSDSSFFLICITLTSFGCQILWLGIWVLYWISREGVDRLVYCLILVGLLQVSLHLVWCWLLVCSYYV